MIVTYRESDGINFRDSCMSVLINPNKVSDLIFEYHDCNDVIELKSKFISEMSKKFDEAVLNSFSICNDYANVKSGTYKNCR